MGIDGKEMGRALSKGASEGCHSGIIGLIVRMAHATVANRAHGARYVCFHFF